MLELLRATGIRVSEAVALDRGDKVHPQVRKCMHEPRFSIGVDLAGNLNEVIV
jgi:hypothetical protein